jgi:O-antigen/teichoic acid export membrane protein
VSTLRSRLLKSFAASALGPVVTSVFQVITVPLYLRSWGTHLYGEWLILAAVPAYLSLTDFGFASVAAVTMNIDVAGGRKDQALTTFQCAFALTAVIGLVMLSLIVASTLLPLKQLLGLTIMSEAQTRVIFVLLSLWILVALQSNLNQAGFRGDGNYAFGVMSVNIVRLIEAIAVSIAVILKASPVCVAAIMLVNSTVGMLVNRWSLRIKSPWLKFGFKYADAKRTKELVVPALGYMAFPIGDAVSLQGMTLAIGMVLGPVAVVAFSTLRTLTRLVIQAIRIIMYSISPEISAAQGAGDLKETRRLHQISCQLSLWTSMIAAVALAFGGDFILRLWTHNRVSMNHPTFWMLLGVVVANSVWHGSSALMLASNQHSKAGGVYLVVTVLSLGLAVALMEHFKLPGAAAALLLVDLIYGPYVVRASLTMLDEPVWTWLRGIAHVPGRLPWLRRASA